MCDMRLNPFITAITLTAAVFASSGAMGAEALPWKERVLLVFASGSNAALADQRQKVEAATEALHERDMTVLAVIGTDKVEKWLGTENGGDAAALRARFQVPADREFIIFLIGKDGGTKWRSEQPSDLADVTGLVDEMPMRQGETLKGG
jgi:hypothetical protein